MAPVAKLLAASLAARSAYDTSLTSRSAGELAARATYRDNNLNFALSSAIFTGSSLRSCKFQVTGMSITPGQDDDGHNHIGDTKTFASTLSFSVGRQGSSDVANWWNSNIAGDRTTFNHAPDSLNFAFIGDLYISLGGSGVTAVFRDIGIAQGHSAATNNWWFGGKNCVHDQSKGDNVVTCEGADTDGNPMLAGFERGNAAGVTLEQIGHVVGEVAGDIPLTLPKVAKRDDEDGTDVDEILITDIEYVRMPGRADPAGTVLNGN